MRYLSIKTLEDILIGGCCFGVRKNVFMINSSFNEIPWKILCNISKSLCFSSVLSFFFPQMIEWREIYWVSWLCMWLVKLRSEVFIVCFIFRNVHLAITSSVIKVSGDWF